MAKHVPELVMRIEALLFVAEKPVAVAALANMLEASQDDVRAALHTLEQSLAGRGIRLMRTGESYQLTTAPEYAADVERFLGVQLGSKLSTAALETLAIIAYRQPLTRAAIEAIRGVNADRALATLLGRGLVTEVGRLETVGRPVLFGTTPEFLQFFGIASLEQLPPLSDADVEKLKTGEEE